MAQRKQHGGRVTPSKKQRETIVNDRVPEPSSRYTQPKLQFRLRPRWHRVAGWVGVVLGILIVILNDAMLMTEGLVLLPFGHRELYMLLALLVAGSSTWFLGLFDHGTTIYD